MQNQATEGKHQDDGRIYQRGTCRHYKSEAVNTSTGAQLLLRQLRYPITNLLWPSQEVENNSFKFVGSEQIQSENICEPGAKILQTLPEVLHATRSGIDLNGDIYRCVYFGTTQSK